MIEHSAKIVGKLKNWFNDWRTSYDAKTFLNSFGSLMITTFFALYNGFLGLMHASPWHGSICIYYILLVSLRFSVLMAERYVLRQKKQGENRGRIRLMIYLLCSVLLLVLNLCLIGPISLLVRMRRPVNMTLIPAITMAAYAFAKISMASFHLVKRKRSGNCLVRLLRMINFIDAMLSIVSLQNTLIMVVSHDSGNIHMLTLSAVSSGLIWLAIVVLSCRTLLWGIRQWKGPMDRAG